MCKKNIGLIEDHSSNISEKVWSIYLQWLHNESHFFSIINCHTNSVLWEIINQNIKGVKANMITTFIKFLPNRAYGF